MKKNNSFLQQYGVEIILLVVIAMLAVVLVIVLSSHSKGKREAGSKAEGSMSAVESDQDSSEDAADQKWSITHVALPQAFEKATVLEDRIYGCYYENDVIMISICDMATGKEVERHEIPEFEEIQGITADKDGEVYLVTEKNGQGTIWRIGTDGTVQRSETQVAMSGNGYRILLICSDNSGRRYLCYEGDDIYEEPSGAKFATAILRVYVLDQDMNYVCKTDVKRTYLTTVITGEDGAPVIFGEDGDGFYTQKIGTKEGESFEQVRMDDVMPWELERGNGYLLTEQGILFYRDGALQLYSMEQAKTEKLLELSAAGICEEDVISIGMKGECIEIIDQYKGSDHSEYTLASPGEDASRQTVTIGMMFLNDQMREMIAAYNRKQTAVTLVPVIYREKYDQELAYQRLTMELFQGKAPDLILTDGIDFDVLAGAGAFLDLYSLMDQDPEYGRDTFVKSVLKAHEINGKLYEMGPSFFLYSMFGAKSVVKGRSGVGMQELLQILRENGGDINSIYGFSADESVMTTLCALGMDEFIDWEAGTCDFTQEGFLDVLNFAKEYQGKFHESLYNALHEKELLFVLLMIGSVEDYSLWNGIFGETVEFIGYPTTHGSGTVAYFTAGLTINAKTKHVSECWDFMKEYLLSGYRDELGFPIVREQLEEVLKASTEEKYMINEVGKRERCIKKHYQERDNKKATVNVYKASQEEANVIRNLIENVSGKHAYHIEIVKIIEEEAESCFQGQKSAEQVAGIIQNRVQLYLHENQ